VMLFLFFEGDSSGDLPSWFISFAGIAYILY
jgi:hypothetical protein